MRKGFTLLELLIVIIIIGVLAIVAFTQYQNLTERARVSEATSAIGSIRTAQKVYHEDEQTFTDTMDNLAGIIQPLPTTCAQETNWFSYDLAGSDANVMISTATRCGTGTGKPPGLAAGRGIYIVRLTENVTGEQLRETNISGTMVSRW